VDRHERISILATRGALALCLCLLVVLGVATPPAFDARAIGVVVAAVIIATLLVIV
jgi:hypothetical protein